MPATQPKCKPSANGRDVSAELVAGWLRLFFGPGEVVELRAVEVERREGWSQTESGYFDYDHLEEMAKAALEVERYALGVYFCLNPLKPGMLSRRVNRIAKAREGKLTSDSHVLRRKWLLIDADPVREPSDIPSTDEEKEDSRQTILAVRTFLAGRGWPEPVLADSGNGHHLLYPVTLPPDDGEVVKRVLEAVAARFDTDRVKIDRKVFNPARITKLYGTLSRKGDHTSARPHRRSGILEIPEEVGT